MDHMKNLLPKQVRRMKRDTLFYIENGNISFRLSDLLLFLVPWVGSNHSMQYVALLRSQLVVSFRFVKQSS